MLLLAAPMALPAQVQRADDYLARMDRDGDGVLSAAEQPGGRGEAITREAHRALLAARFHRQDANRDGFLDARELSAPPR